MWLLSEVCIGAHGSWRLWDGLVLVNWDMAGAEALGRIDGERSGVESEIPR